MGPEGVILVNSPISTFQQSLTHSALVGKFSTVSLKLIVGQQGVVDGSNPLLIATFLPLNLANGEEEEEDGSEERRQIGDGRHLEVCGALGCSLHW